MTVTHVSASAFNVSIYTRTYFCYYFSWIANICCRLLRWRQKPQCSKPRYCCATREVRRRTDGTVRPAPTLPISANSCFNRYGRFSLVDLNTIRARKTDGTVENTVENKTCDQLLLRRLIGCRLFLQLCSAYYVRLPAKTFIPSTSRNSSESNQSEFHIRIISISIMFNRRFNRRKLLTRLIKLLHKTIFIIYSLLFLIFFRCIKYNSIN